MRKDIKMIFEAYSKHKRTEDPGIDNPDLYKHPERYIEAGVLPYVLKLWKNGIQTWESGEDQDLTESIKESDTPTPTAYMEWFIKFLKKDGYKGLYRHYIVSNGKQLRQKAFVIINLKDLDKAKALLPAHIETERGTGGFCPSEYSDKAPKAGYLAYIQWSDI